jgi:uncharacterized protein (TIGR02453 family)
MGFDGFPKDATKFLTELKKNNNRGWFNANKDRYKSSVEGPAKEFLEDMADRLTDLAKAPLGGKVFRIYRDVRFSKDKTPYNSHVRVAFFTSEAAQGSCGMKPGFYFSLEPAKIILGAGSRDFPKTALEAYREAVLDSKKGVAFQKVIDKASANNGFRIHDPELKRVPAGLDADHPRSDLLRHKSLSVWHEEKLSAIVNSPKLGAHLIKTYRKMMPVFDWLYAL